MEESIMLLGSEIDQESGEVDYTFVLTKYEYEKLMAGKDLKKRVEFSGGISEFTLSYKLVKKA